MKLKLLKCGICDTWHNPAIRQHCPYCGAMALRITTRKTRYYSINSLRAIEVVRGIPNYLKATILNTLITR